MPLFRNGENDFERVFNGENDFERVFHYFRQIKIGMTLK